MLNVIGTVYISVVESLDEMAGRFYLNNGFTNIHKYVHKTRDFEDVPGWYNGEAE